MPQEMSDTGSASVSEPPVVFVPCTLCRAPVDLAAVLADGGVVLCGRHESAGPNRLGGGDSRLELWTLVDPGETIATDFYCSSQEAQAALDAVLRADADSEAVPAGVRGLTVVRIVLDADLSLN
jgi:hypothetical protein